ncbi:MAG: TfuA-like protein, partial [Gaiellaceae bacterium]
MTAVVYLGPSLPLDEARAILPDAIYLPPVAQGDVLSLVEREHERPDVIGIVDGVFYLQPPIWHKEILYALELGIPVYGASSMGALRAAECDRFGMIGVGEVYRSYASGELSDDDDVALVYGDAQHGWPATSEPLVNVRATLAAEVASGRLSEVAERAVIASAKRLWFPERRRASILAAAREDGLGKSDLAIVTDALEHRYVDVKKSDARALLETLRDRDPSEKPAPFTFDRSIVFLAFTERDRQVSHGGLPIRLEEIKRHAAVEHPGFAEILDRALDRLLVTELARVWEVEPTEAEIDDEIERLRWRFRIGEGDDAIAA